MYQPYPSSGRREYESLQGSSTYEPPELSKYQRNDLFRAVESSRMPITGFVLETYIGQDPVIVPYPVTVIRHRATGALFGIMPFRPDEFLLRYQMGPASEGELFVFGGYGPYSCDPDSYEIPTHEARYPWGDVLRVVRGWAIGIGESIAAAQEYERMPDLWDTLYRAQDYAAENDGGTEGASFTAQHNEDAENAPFTSTEQAEVSDQIRMIKEYLRDKYKLSSEQMSRVEDALNHAEEASRRMGRKDWLILFNGAILSLIISDLIPPQAAQSVLKLVIHGIGHLFGWGGLPPPLSHG
jgi:hypothetical protein